ncbi:MAG: GNAT family N-acetyltransferase [Planctomycetia bacterium]|nr:GNAT family N-acetyltransferase [Planctomycetia bacterium]
MISFRTFKNGDPPCLAKLWQAEAALQPWMRPVPTPVLEDLVISKPYFDKLGLLVAVAGGQVVGFAHAGFGPDAARSKLDTSIGVICMVLVDAAHRQQGVGRELVARCEQYLAAKGAREIYLGGVSPYAPFYFGMYGGSDAPGVLASNVAMQALGKKCGYQVVRQVCLLTCGPESFKSVVDRKLLAMRRTAEVRVTEDPAAADWWEACLLSDFHRLRYDLVAKDAGQAVATALFWTMDPLSWRAGKRAVGLFQFSVTGERRRQGAATLLLTEAVKRWHAEGCDLVETQVPEENAPTLKLLSRMGFVEDERGLVYWKKASS